MHERNGSGRRDEVTNTILLDFGNGLNLIIQIPVLLEITLFNDNISFKIMIEAVVSLVVLGLLLFIRVRCFSDIFTNKRLSLRTFGIWTVLTLVLVMRIKAILILSPSLLFFERLYE